MVSHDARAGHQVSNEMTWMSVLLTSLIRPNPVILSQVVSLFLFVIFYIDLFVP